MSSDLHLHFHLPSGADFSPIIINQLRKILMDQAALAVVLTEVSADLTATGTTLDKVADEVTLAMSNAGVVSPEVEALVATLKTQAGGLKAKATNLDGMNPDAVPGA